MATPKKKLHWKKKVLKANCNTSALLQGEQQKKWKRPCSIPRSVKDCRKERCVNGLPSRVVPAFEGRILIWGPKAFGLDPGRISVVLETQGAPGACGPAPCTSSVHSWVPLRVDASLLQLLDRNSLGFLLFFFANYRETEHLHLLHLLQLGQ